MSEDNGAHDEHDSELLRELGRLRAAAGRDPARQREIIGELISGWDAYFRPWLVLKVGRRDGDDVAGYVVLRLLRLLLRQHQFTAAWGAVVWRTVRDEAFRFHRQRERRPEQLVAEVYDDPGTAPLEDPLDEVRLDPEEDARRLMELVTQLSERDQRVIQLTVIEERPRPEAAAMLGMKTNALDQAKFRALKRLAELAARNGVSGNRKPDEKIT